MLVGCNIGRKEGRMDGFLEGRKLQKEYDNDVFNKAMEMNKYIQNYDNEEDK